MEFSYDYVKEKLFLDNVSYALPQMVRLLEMITYSAVCLFIPMLLSHPQLLVGVAVNAVLILSAHYLKGYEVLPAIIMPSVGVVLGATLFSGLTRFVIYMIPFIWIGNAILVYSFKRFHLSQKRNYLSVLLFGSAAKSVFLGLAALGLIALNIVPFSLLIPFSVLQIGTAMIAGLAVYPIIRARAKLLAA